jgi:hypothetical protein
MKKNKRLIKKLREMYGASFEYEISDDELLDLSKYSFSRAVASLSLAFEDLAEAGKNKFKFLKKGGWPWGKNF